MEVTCIIMVLINITPGLRKCMNRCYHNFTKSKISYHHWVLKDCNYNKQQCVLTLLLNWITNCG